MSEFRKKKATPTGNLKGVPLRASRASSGSGPPPPARCGSGPPRLRRWQRAGSTPGRRTSRSSSRAPPCGDDPPGIATAHRSHRSPGRRGGGTAQALEHGERAGVGPAWRHQRAPATSTVSESCSAPLVVDRRPKRPAWREGAGRSHCFSSGSRGFDRLTDPPFDAPTPSPANCPG